MLTAISDQKWVLPPSKTKISWSVIHFCTERESSKGWIFPPLHAGEFVVPGILFLYIAGYIGWAGRSYLQFAKKTDKPNESEIIIDVPVALGMMASGFLWPLSAWNELVTGELLVAGDEVTVSPR